MKKSMKWLVATIAAFSVTAAVANPKQANAPVPSAPVKGEVVELLEAKNYTYMRLKTDQGETWAAVPKADLRKGSKVTVENALLTRDFQSPSLKRKFDTIVFGTLVGAAPAQAAAPAAAPAVSMSAAVPAAAPGTKGEILEIREADPYVYLRLKTRQGEIWAAVPKAPVRKGSTVTVENAMTMTNFESKSLNKKFDKILFGTLAGSAAAPAAAGPVASGMPGAKGDPHAGAAKPAAAAAPIKVAKAAGADGYTVAEIVGGTAKLKDKTVQVRGQVVKFTGGVMGKNWVHLQDGSGSATNQSNDILVTTQDATRIGEVVLAKGVVRVNRDYGSGYTYPVVVEEAKLGK